MGKFWESYKFPRLNPDERKVNTLITNKKTETVIKSLKKKEGQDQTASQVNSIKYSDIIPSFKPSQKPEKKQLLTHSEGQHYPDTNTHTDNTKIENYRPMSLINIDGKILNKILTNQKQQGGTGGRESAW